MLPEQRRKQPSGVEVMFGILGRYFSRFGGEQRAETAPSADEVRPLIDGIAEGIYKSELRRGGWAADLGVFGPDLFVEEASACLRAIELGTDGSGPPSP